MKRFNRFELKYILTASQAADVRQDLLHNMQPDAHGSADGSYAIASLYYDTAALSFMRAKLEGIKFRRKLRLRRYGDTADQPVFVEIKQRINRTTQKRRLILPMDQGLKLCGGQLPAGIDDAGDVDVAQEVVFLVRGLSLQPTCVVGYQRQAFVGSTYEAGLRVTFDHNMWGAVASNGLDFGHTRHALASQSTVIMEVKANDAVPLWLANLLARHQCDLRRYSKYCAATQKLLDLELLNRNQISLEGIGRG